MHKELRAPVEPKVHKEPWDHKVLKDLVVVQEDRVLKEPWVLKVLKDLKAPLPIRDIREMLHH